MYTYARVSLKNHFYQLECVYTTRRVSKSFTTQEGNLNNTILSIFFLLKTNEIFFLSNLYIIIYWLVIIIYDLPYFQVLYYLRKSGMTCLPEGRRDHRRNSCPTIQSDVSRGSTINKSSVHYKVKPKESCSLLLTPSKSEQASSEKKASQASTSV